jgi:V/A-type H+-transporting ATPase subunit A
MISAIYDGIQRPLDVIREKEGDFVTRGIHVPSLDRARKWNFVPLVELGQEVVEGDFLGEVEETPLIKHKIMVPPGVNGKVKDIQTGDHTVDSVIARIDTGGDPVEVRMFQTWSIRKNRRVSERLMPDTPLVTGQRVLDTLFPLAKGGTACVPGPFGSGKTVVQHQLARWSDAEIIVFVACGERGNEVADLLLSFPELEDPHTGRPLMERTIIIANTSNMPVAAREASIYTGMTIGEYFRDMGYSVALMADSSSRWAEALREISGRMEEMPGEEGYPAYLASRIAAFYERAGKVECLGSDRRIGALSVIGAVSPPGGDLSDPVVQATLRVVKVFWALDDRLANARHFPAINWLNSYSLYVENVRDFWKNEVAEDFFPLRQEAMRLLEEEAELQEIARLVGVESMSLKDRLVLESARSIREDFLHQNAFHPQDTYTSLRKQYLMLRSIIHFHRSGLSALEQKVELADILGLEVREKMSKVKFFSEEDTAGLDVYIEIDNAFKELLKSQQ